MAVEPLCPVGLKNASANFPERENRVTWEQKQRTSSRVMAEACSSGGQWHRRRRQRACGSATKFRGWYHRRAAKVVILFDDRNIPASPTSILCHTSFDCLALTCFLFPPAHAFRSLGLSPVLAKQRSTRRRELPPLKLRGYSLRSYIVNLAA